MNNLIREIYIAYLINPLEHILELKLGQLEDEVHCSSWKSNTRIKKDIQLCSDLYMACGNKVK